MLAWSGRILAWAVILAAVAVLLLAVVVPRLAGATPYTVLTSSMEPILEPGTLVVVRPMSADEIGVGQVITYQLRSGEPAVATHRVVEVGKSLSGETRFTTRGDANEIADPTPVRPEQVRGGLWYAVPYLGHLNQLISGEYRAIGRIALAAVLLGYAGFMFMGALRDRRRPEEGRSSA